MPMEVGDHVAGVFWGRLRLELGSAPARSN
mgnify:CR=1 FL=1